MLEPVPPLARSGISGQMQRNKAASAYEDMFKELGLADYLRDICGSHPSYTVDEDQYILAHVGINWVNFLLAPHKNHEFAVWWLNDENKDCVYEYYKTFIQMLNSVDAPQSHWLSKTPVHTLYLNTLIRYCPTASLIMIHRRLDETIPSTARLAIAYTSAYFDSDKTGIKVDKNSVVELILHMMDIFIRRLVEFRRANQNIPVLDILYDDLMAHPIDTVRQIYKHFELVWSMDFELAMRAWLRDNPQGKQGRNIYTLEEFGLQREGIEKCYEEYNSMFLKGRDQRQKDNDVMKS